MLLDIPQDFATLNEEHRFTLAANGYTIYLTGTDHGDNYVSKTYVFVDQDGFFAALQQLERVEVS
jgi:hypothetical protein